MAFKYKQVVQEIVALAGIPESDTFDFSKNDPYGVVESYFQFCQLDLTTKNEAYDIQPARIYIRANMEVNAAAKKCNDYYIMRVNFGTILSMFRLYTDRREVFNGEQLSDFKHLHEQLDASLDYLLFQVSTQFTYYHEKGHLIQASPINEIWLQESYVELTPEQEPFSLQRHLYEFDADLHASTLIGFHLLQYWRKQSAELQTDENLNLIISLGTAAVLSYFIFLQQKYLKIYYEASTHPHPLIRISYILDNLVKAVEGNLNRKILNSNIITANAFRITDALFNVSGDQWVRNFGTLFLQERDRIKQYIQGVLWENAQAVPELTIHRLFK